MSPNEARAQLLEVIDATLVLESRHAQEPEVRKAAAELLKALRNGQPLTPPNQSGNTPSVPPEHN